MQQNVLKPNCYPIWRFLFPVLLFFVSIACTKENADDDTRKAEVQDSVLIDIRDEFNSRVADFFNEQKDKPLVSTTADKKVKRSGWNDPQRYSYLRIEYATTSFWFEQNIDSANLALVEYSNYFISDPEKILHRDHFHWHSEMALRLIEMFGQNGTRKPGLLKVETENKILEAVWLYVKRRQADQVVNNTKAEADKEISKTWYIYESENHHSQSFTTQWHFAKLAKDRPGFKDRKYDDGLTAAEYFVKWNDYLKMFFTERAKKGIYIEMMSRDYNHKSVKGIFNVFDFATDPELKRKAGLYLDLYFTYWGQEQINGVAGGGKSRLYQDISPGTSEYGYIFFGVGDRPHFESLLLSAMTTAYRPPLVIVDIVSDRKGRGIYEVTQRAMGLAEKGYNEPPIYHMRTDSGGIVRYSYCTPEFVIGTAMLQARPASDWALISSQNRSHGVIFAGDTIASILPQYDKTENNRSYNSQWSVQRKGTMICQKLKTSERTGRTVVWFSGVGLSNLVENKNLIFSESEGAYAAVRVVDGGYTWEDGDGNVKGKWLICENDFSPIILEVDQKENYKSFEEFQSRVIANAMTFANNIVNYSGIYGDTFTFYADYSKVPHINNKAVDYAPAKVCDSPFLKSEWNSGVVHIQKGTRSLTLDFNAK